MLGMFYYRQISPGELKLLIRNQEWRTNPKIIRRIRVGGVDSPYTVDEIEYLHFIQKLEDKYKLCQEDRVANIFVDGEMQFHMNNIDGWHP